jgi:hypothetical protein
MVSRLRLAACALLAYVVVHVATEEAATSDGGGSGGGSAADASAAASAMDGRCTGCRHQEHANNLFDHLAFSVKYSERLSYLALDMSWLDRLLHDHAKVHISFHDFSKASLDSAAASVDELHYQVHRPHLPTLTSTIFDRPFASVAPPPRSPSRFSTTRASITTSSPSTTTARVASSVRLLLFRSAQQPAHWPPFVAACACLAGTVCLAGKNETEAEGDGGRGKGVGKKEDKDKAGEAKESKEAAKVSRRVLTVRGARRLALARAPGAAPGGGGKGAGGGKAKEGSGSAPSASSSGKAATAAVAAKDVRIVALSPYDEEFQVLWVVTEGSR